MTPDKARFQRIIRSYYKEHGRAMPWRRTRDPYRILVSEVMLQQTQVARVRAFYPRFIARFPDFASLARAKTAAVLRAWQGLGYNRRALALQKLSRTVLEKYNGRLPRERAALEALPGIGKATAGSIRAFAWNEPEIFIETNIRRVFIHLFFPGRKKVTDEDVKRYIERTLPRGNMREWYWALMDYGAMLGRGRRGVSNPNTKSAHYRKQPRFTGSSRELRGAILREALKKGSSERVAKDVAAERGIPVARVRAATKKLIQEGFIKK